VGTKCTRPIAEFPASKKRKVEAEFSGGDVSSDGGIVLLREADRYLSLLDKVANVIPDPRQSAKVRHPVLSMLKQRIYAIALGNEDLNDHDTLRNDPGWQCAIDTDRQLASSSTLCRLEGRAERQAAIAIHEILIDTFIASFHSAPKELILDIDATDIPVYGNQENKFFHGFYNHHCFLPLYVTCNGWVLVSYLRPSKLDAARHSGAIISLLVGKLRAAWPKVKIIIRGDSGFCRWRLMSWCERNNAYYILGIARNRRLEAIGQELSDEAALIFSETGEKQRLFTEFKYAAGTWKKQRRVIMKAEHTSRGSNPRFVITNLDAVPEAIYDKYYCPRGDMENIIKQQMEMFSERTSCHKWWSNQLRLLFSTLAYTLVHVIREVGLKGTALARAQAGTIRLKLLKIGAVILHNTRRVRFLLSTSYPYQSEFLLVTRRLRC
jgi:hypothetical protein